jgi:hypothetical protein
LPVSGTKPTVEAIRKRLGGRASSDGAIGEVVALGTVRGVERIGVVIFAYGDEVDVWTGAGTPLTGVVRRTQRSKTGAIGGPIPREMLVVADDARVFGRLHEGSRVRYQQGDGQVHEATLVEKCRYGALVLRDDGTVVGVGFRRIWPAGPASARVDN